MPSWAILPGMRLCMSFVAALVVAGCDEKIAMTADVHGGPAQVTPGQPDPAPEISSSVDGATVHATMRNYMRTCGPTPEFRFEPWNNELRLMAVPPDGEMAAMQCEYTASFTIQNVRAGNYEVIVKGPGGGEVARTKVVVPES